MSTEAVSETRQSATSKYEAEHVQWLRHQADLEAELHKLRAKLSHDRSLSSHWLDTSLSIHHFIPNFLQIHIYNTECIRQNNKLLIITPCVYVSCDSRVSPDFCCSTEAMFHLDPVYGERCPQWTAVVDFQARLSTACMLTLTSHLMYCMLTLTSHCMLTLTLTLI